jgi:hypothetical protein
MKSSLLWDMTPWSPLIFNRHFSFTLASCLAYSSTMKMGATYSSETSVGFQRATRSYIQEDKNLHYSLLLQFAVLCYFTPCVPNSDCAVNSLHSRNSQIRIMSNVFLLHSCIYATLQLQYGSSFHGHADTWFPLLLTHNWPSPDFFYTKQCRVAPAHFIYTLQKIRCAFTTILLLLL